MHPFDSYRNSNEGPQQPVDMTPRFTAAVKGKAKRRRKETTNPSEGSPWQAMKKLRVDEEKKHGGASPSIMMTPSSDSQESYYSSSCPLDTKAATAGSPWPAAYSSNDEMMAEESPAKSRNPLRNGDSTPMSMDAEYKQVNHILGALHLERMARVRAENPSITASHSRSTRTEIFPPTCATALEGTSSTTSISSQPYVASPYPSPRTLTRRKRLKLQTNSKLA